MRAILDRWRLALRAIVRSPLRSGLTIFGMLVAVTSVVTVDAIGAGGRNLVSRQIDSIGSNFIIVLPQPSTASGARAAQGSGMRLTEEDAGAILRQSSSVAAIAPALHAAVQIVIGDRNWSTQAFGTRLSILDVRNWPLDRGSPWSANDEATKSKVIVLGATVARKLFGSRDPVGQTARIGRYPYRVLGVLAVKGQSPFGSDQDDVVLLPSTSFRARILHTPPGFAGALMASATSSATIGRAVRQIDAVLRERHHVGRGFDPDFVIRTQQELAEIKDRISATLSLLMLFVAAVGLVVGGVGIMNVMLVSVTERTPEIGIQMAIGARERDIHAQFLVEAVVLACLGGSAGVVTAGGAVAGLGALLGWTVGVRPTAAAISVLVSAATGVAFGLVPARRAAKLDPIVALRRE